MKRFIVCRVNMKLVQLFIALTLCGGVFYIFQIKSNAGLTFWGAAEYFRTRYKVTDIFERYPKLLPVNFTLNSNGIRVNPVYPHNRSLPQLYRTNLNSDERDMFLHTLAIFSNTLYEANITFMLYGGSMLGARRHHGFIPWDDDIDVWINGTEKSRVKKLLAANEGFAVHSPVNFQWKFFYKNLKTLKQKQFRWPYIDIFFFCENSTHIWEEQNVHRYKYYKRSHILPLVFRPFETFLLPTPCAIEEFVGQNALDNCKTTDFIHRTEAFLPSYHKALVPCKSLYKEYPFVFKYVYNTTFSIEELRHGTNIIRSFFVPTNPCVQ